MWKTCCRWLAIPLVLGSLCRPAYAQTEYLPTGLPGRGPPIVEFAIAAMATILLLVIVCTPSRKR